jgi:XTP/dITP diphosphohydrolase
VLCDGKGKELGMVQAICSGLIAKEERGSNGFGFDPLFIVPRYKKTFGELDPSVKAKISHRARALVKFRKLLEK